MTDASIPTKECCIHAYTFAGVVYSYEDYPMAGSGAHARIYQDKFFCSQCLDTQYRNARMQGNSYMPAIAGSFPK